MKFVVARWLGALVLGCCTGSEVLAQEQAEPTPAGAPAAESERLVDILNYRIEGNSVLPRVAVERAVMPYLGPKRPASDVEAARAALEKAYRNAGYETVAVQIPEQDVRNGVIRLDVVELKVGRLRVADARYVSPDDIKAKVPSLAEGSVPNYREVSREMAALNKSGERLVSPTLRAGDTPGTVDVELQVEDQLPFHGSLEINDRTSSRTDRLRAAASLRYTNLFQRGHTLGIQGQMTPTDPAQSWSVSGSYVAPIGASGFTVLGYVVHSKNDVLAVNGVNVQGSGDTLGLRGLYSFTTGTDKQLIVHQLTAGIDYKTFRESLILDEESVTPIDYFPLTIQYSMAQRQLDYDFDLSLTLTAGLRGLDASETEFRLKRYNASANWTAIRADVSYVAKLPGDWRASALFSGQIASGPLISNEQFSAGGLDSVRGYYESQELGDDGVSAQLQIDSPSFGSDKGALDELRLFAFADGAVLHVRDPLAGQEARPELLSVGAGLRLRAFDFLNLSTLLAAPLLEKGSVPMDIGDDLRAQFRLWAEF